MPEREARPVGRVEKRMYRRARGQALLRRALLFLTALIIAAGLASRVQSGRGLQAEAVVIWEEKAVIPNIMCIQAVPTMVEDALPVL